MSSLQSIHPGEHLAEFLEEFGVSQDRLAREINVPPRRVHGIIHAKRPVSADMALRLGRFFGTTPEFWMNLQSRYALESKRDRLANDLSQIHSVQEITLAALSWLAGEQAP